MSIFKESIKDIDTLIRDLSDMEKAMSGLIDLDTDNFSSEVRDVIMDVVGNWVYVTDHLTRIDG